MDDSPAEIRELTRLVRDLLARVSRLEQVVGVSAEPGAPPSGRDEGRGPRLEVVPPAGMRSASSGQKPASSDLEARIGSHWLNGIGIAALLIGVSYFLKYAFESNWIGPAGQIVIGLLAGMAVVIWSERFRRRGYPVFSYSLKAVGIGAMYLSLWAAFQVYRLVPVGLVFAGMVAVTAATAALALAQEAEILAVFALAGGFVTPVLLANGQNHEVELFAYLALLDVATVVMIFSGAWRRLLILSFAGTAVLYFAWYAEYYSRGQFAATFAFATLFFAVFAVATALGRSEAGDRFQRILLFIAVLNGVIYFLDVYLILETSAARAWFAVVLAALYLMLSRQGRTQSDLRGTHLGLAMGFISVAVALRLQEVWISLGWFVEAAALMAAGFWRKSALIRWLALALIAATIVKVFAYDIWGLSRGYRIVSFVFLGVLLLAVSFAYQRDWLKLSRSGTQPRRTSVET